MPEEPKKSTDATPLHMKTMRQKKRLVHCRCFGIHAPIPAAYAALRVYEGAVFWDYGSKDKKRVVYAQAAFIPDTFP